MSFVQPKEENPTEEKEGKQQTEEKEVNAQNNACKPTNPHLLLKRNLHSISPASRFAVHVRLD